MAFDRHEHMTPTKCPVVWGSHGCSLPVGHPPYDGLYGTHHCCEDDPEVPGGSGYGLGGVEYYTLMHDGEPNFYGDYVVRTHPDLPLEGRPHEGIKPWGWEVRDQ